MNRLWQLSVVCGATLAFFFTGCAGRNPLSAFHSLPGFGDSQLAQRPDELANASPSYTGTPFQGTPFENSGLPDATGEKKSFGANVAAAVRQAGTSVSEALTIKPRVTPANDPVNLASDPGPLGPGLFISAGQIHEQRGNFEAAKNQYQRALDAAPNDQTALLSFARVHDRMEQFDEAINIYQRAVHAHPNSAIALNDLGLCYARKGNLDQSIRSLQRAVQMDPKKSLYRNNLARVLIEVGQLQPAFEELASVSGPAVAHYNLGYFLYQRQQFDEAMHHFSQAVQLDPKLTAARDMLLRMGRVPPLNRQSASDRQIEADEVQPVIYRVGDEGSDPQASIATTGSELSVEQVNAEPAIYMAADPVTETEQPMELQESLDAAPIGAADDVVSPLTRGTTDYGSAFH